MIGSIYETPRPCPVCNQDFLPPRRADGIILICCSEACDRRAGLRPMQHTSTQAAPRPKSPKKPRKRAPSANRRTLEESSGFGRRLSETRVERGLPVEDLAARIGVHPNSIGHWQMDRVDPPLSKLILLARVLNVSLDYLILGRTDKEIAA